MSTASAVSNPFERALCHSPVAREAVQDFVPLAQSLEWELGQRYYTSRGNKAFVGDARPIPFVINNDGILSHNSAEVFFANLNDSTNSADIVVLELGIGTGLFARYFLDHFRELCRKHRKDYYERLTYIAADSELLASDAAGLGPQRRSRRPSHRSSQ